MVIHEAFEDLGEALNLVEQVLIPDHIDDYGVDWDLLDLLYAIRDQINRMARSVADANRAKISGSWVGVPTNGAPLRIVNTLPPDPEG